MLTEANERGLSLTLLAIPQDFSCTRAPGQLLHVIPPPVLVGTRMEWRDRAPGLTLGPTHRLMETTWLLSSPFP